LKPSSPLADPPPRNKGLIAGQKQKETNCFHHKGLIIRLAISSGTDVRGRLIDQLTSHGIQKRNPSVSGEPCRAPGPRQQRDQAMFRAECPARG